MSSSGVDSPPSVPVIYYAFQIIANTVGIAGLSLVIGGVTGEFAETALVLVIFALIRFLTGGYHIKSGLLCVAVSTAVVTLIPHINVNEMITYILTAIALIVTAALAPANYDKYARISIRYYPLLKFISCAVIAVNFAIGSELLAITYIVQAALLLPRGGSKNK